MSNQATLQAGFWARHWWKVIGVLVIATLVVGIVTGVVTVSKPKDSTQCRKGGTLAKDPVVGVMRCWNGCPVGFTPIPTDVTHCTAAGKFGPVTSLANWYDDNKN